MLHHVVRLFVNPVAGWRAVLAFGLVALVALLAVTVLLWSSGLGPVFAAG